MHRGYEASFHTVNSSGLSQVSVRPITSRLWSVISSWTITAFEARDLTLSSPIFNNDRNGGGLYPSEIAKVNTAMFSFAQPRSRHRHRLNGDSWADYTVLVADTTKLAGWLAACCLACTLFHCGARGVRSLSMLVDKMRAPLQLGWSLSLLNRPGLVLFVGESQKEGQLSTNSIFWEGKKTVFNQWLSCETLL